MTTIYLRDFPEDLHHKVKIQAAKEKISMKDLIIKVLEDYIGKQSDRPEDKLGRK